MITLLHLAHSGQPWLSIPLLALHSMLLDCAKNAWHSRALALLLGWQLIAFDVQSAPFSFTLPLLVLQSRWRGVVQNGQV